MRRHTVFILSLLVAGISFAGEPQRARDLGIPFDGSPGPLNAITDVAGVTVGHATLIEDLADGRAVRTGVTAVLPRGEETLMRPVFGGWFALNGNGEMTGTTWLEESGQLEGPVMLTNTHSVGTVHQETIAWRIRQGEADATGYWWALPVVAETWDGYLNDINGFHVKPEHVDAALDGAASRAGRRGQCRRWHRHGVLRVQGRHRHRVAGGGCARRLVQPGRAGAGQLRDCAINCGSRVYPSASISASTGSTRSPTRPPVRAVRSSSSSRPTRRCCRTSSNASPGARPSASDGSARSPATDRVTSLSPSRRPTTHWVVPTAC